MILTSTFGIGEPMVSALSVMLSVAQVIRATGEHSVWPNTMVKARAQPLLESSDNGSRHRRAAGIDRIDRGKIGGRKGRMLHHRDQHGRHAQHRVAAIGFQEFDHKPGIEGLEQHLGGAPGDGAEHATDATAGVEKRHGGYLNRAVGDAGAVGGVRAVVDQSAMMQQGALGKSRGSGGVLDHHRIGRSHFRQAQVWQCRRIPETHPIDRRQ